MQACNYPTQAELTAIYDMTNGKLCRKTDGKPCGFLHKGSGRNVIKLGKRNLYLARLMWIYCNGDIPNSMCIDHINRVKTDDRLTNLRLVSKADNCRNVWRQRNTSGFRNVSFNKASGKWHARLAGKDKKRVHLGLFDSKESAHEAVQEFLLSEFPHLTVS